VRKVKPARRTPRAEYPLFARVAAWLWPAGLWAGAAHADATLPPKPGPGRGTKAAKVAPKADGAGQGAKRGAVQNVYTFDDEVVGDIVIVGGVTVHPTPVDTSPPQPVRGAGGVMASPAPADASPPPADGKPGDKKPCPAPQPPKTPPGGGKVPPPPILGGKMIAPPRLPEPSRDADDERPPTTTWLHPHGAGEPCHAPGETLVTIRVPRRGEEA